ncbi:MAG: hypothetical protein ACREMZ_13210 [Gemmatimonadales bacterium]
MNYLNYPGGPAVAVSIAALLVAGCTDRETTPTATEPIGQVEITSVQQCQVVDRSTEEVIPGVTLTWTSSFLCANAPDEGTYQIEVTVENAAGSEEAVEIDDLAIRGTTPRPRGQGPDATASASGLPLTVAPRQSGSFTVSGTYELVETDEGKKANIHLSALGEGVSSGLEFELGINVQLRGAGAIEGDRAGPGGPSAQPGAGGRPADVPRGGPPSNVPRGGA